MSWESSKTIESDLIHPYDPLKNAAGEAVEEVWESLKLFSGEIKDGFQRLPKER